MGKTTKDEIVLKSFMNEIVAIMQFLFMKSKE